jgi:hypothetical protein
VDQFDELTSEGHTLLALYIRNERYEGVDNKLELTEPFEF